MFITGYVYKHVQRACVWTHALVWKAETIDGGPVTWENLHERNTLSQ